MGSLRVALLLVALGLTVPGETLADPRPLVPADTVRAWIAAGRFAEADSAAHGLLRSAEREHGAESLEAVRALNLIVDAMRAWPASLPYAERAARLLGSIPGRHDEEDAVSWLNLGTIRIRTGDYREARAPLEKALPLAERVFAPDDFRLARALNNLAFATEQEGEDAKAKALYERAIAVRERAAPPGDLYLVTMRLNLGRVCSNVGAYEDGEATYRIALANLTDSTAIAATLVPLGNLQYRMGRYVEARSNLERALPALEAAGDSLDLANGLHAMGLVHRETGDYERAREVFTKALRIREKLLGPDDVEVAVSLDALGVLDDDLGDDAAARPLLERALAIRLEKLGPKHVNTGISLMNLASLLGELGATARAESLCARAVAVLREAYGAKHQLVADGIERQASLRLQAGDAAAARTLYREALSLQEEVLGPGHPDAAYTGLGLAHAEWRLHDPGAALGAALRAEGVARAELRLTERALSEREALRYAATRTNGLGLAFSIARSGLPDSANRNVWDALVRARGSVLDELAWRHRAIASARDTTAARLEARVTASAGRLSSLNVRGPEPGNAEGYKRALAAAREALETAERALAERSATYRTLRASEEIGIREVSAGLPAEAALVGLARYERSDPDRPSGSGGAEYIAFVLGPDARVSVVPLGDASEIEALVSRFLSAAGPEALGIRRSPAAAERACRRVGEELRRAVWDPLAPAIGSAKLVLIAPDGALSLVPFAALPTGASSYLIETGPTIHYLSTERDVAMDEPARREALLAFGGPDFDAAGRPALRGGRPPEEVYRGAHSSCTEFRTVRFRSLPASGREAADVAALWRKQRLPISGVLTGARASEAAFKARAPGAGVLHVATHGFFLDGACPGAGPGRGIGGISLPPASPSPPENPLLLSGLALAGANHRDTAGAKEEDGILTAEEIATLDLSGVRWAVLSACDTGQGEIEAGEGVMGLRRAFRIAGAGTLIMSLWAVDDRATLEWMRDLYAERLTRGRSTAEAVRHAGLDLLRARRKAGAGTLPFYWAGFVAAGDWR